MSFITGFVAVLVFLAVASRTKYRDCSLIIISRLKFSDRFLQNGKLPQTNPMFFWILESQSKLKKTGNWHLKLRQNTIQNKRKYIHSFVTFHSSQSRQQNSNEDCKQWDGQFSHTVAWIVFWSLYRGLIRE